MSDNPTRVVKILVVRHPEKDGDKITAHGAKQAWAAALALQERFGTPDEIQFSGANRTRQAAVVMAAAMGIDPNCAKENEGFHFKEIFEKFYPTKEDRNRFFEELDALHKSAAGDKATLAEALEDQSDVGNYTRDARAVMNNVLCVAADAMGGTGEKLLLALSHSPWTEVASHDPESTPFGLPEAGAMLYTVELGGHASVVIGSEYIEPPLEGKGSYK